METVNIRTIHNGYLVDFGKGKETSYQVGVSNNQVQKMVHDVLAHFTESGFRLVTDTDMVKIHKLGGQK